MAQLKDTVISGSLRATDSLLATNLILSGSQTARYVLAAPTSNGAPSFRALTNADVGLGNVENKALSTWTGTSTIATVGTITSGTWSASTIAVNKGGTGQTSWTQWGVLYASASTTLTNTAAGTAGYLLQGNGAAAPSWIQATNNNTASTIVKRDASGNFSAGTITASLTGNASTATRSTSLIEIKGTPNSTNVATWADTNTNIHHGSNEELNLLRTYWDTPASGNQPVVDLHNMIFSIDNATNYIRLLSFDLRSYQIFTRIKYNGTWQDWHPIKLGDDEFVFTAGCFKYENATRKFTCVGGTNQNWNKQVYSTTGYKECRLTYTIDQNSAYIMVGLNSDPTTDASYTSIDYCWYTQSGGALSIYESNSSISSASGHTTYAAGDELSIEYVEGQVNYYHNGVLCRTVKRDYGARLYFDSSFYNNAGSISNISFEGISHIEHRALRTYYRSTDLSNTNEMRSWNYLYTVGDTGQWATTATKPTGIDNAFGILHLHLHSGNYFYQVGFGGTTNKLYFRNAYNTTTWTDWNTVLASNNYTDYTVKKDGTGASGSWGISVTGSSGSCTGNAATATKATQDSDGNAINSTYLKKSGGTMTGSLTFANGTWNVVGDDCAMGDQNVAGAFCLKGQNGTTNIRFIQYGGTAAGTISWDGTKFSITGTVSTNISGSAGSVAWENTGHPDTFPPSSHTHDYMPTSWRSENVVGAYKGASRSTSTAGYWAAMVNPTSTGSPTMPTTSGWWHILSMDWSGNDTNNWISQLAIPTQDQGGNDKTNNTLFFRHNDAGGTSISSSTWYKVWREGLSITSAVWNDYAEYRQCEELTPGMCVQENDNGKLTASNHRLIPACSIISDTWGFSQGETEKAKTPIAVSGRVLAYTYLPRHMYHAGMAVCSAPGGTIDIMTREEIREYPDAIVGYVSEIPDYEEWGGGEKADRPPVKVNGRIWIKVK